MIIAVRSIFRRKSAQVLEVSIWFTTGTLSVGMCSLQPGLIEGGSFRVMQGFRV